jgi:hypothetical protein
MIELPEYHSRYAKMTCLFLAAAAVIMFSIKGEIGGKDYFESIVYDFNQIFFFEDELKREWEYTKSLNVSNYGNFERFKEVMYEMHHSPADVVGKVISFLLVGMVIPYFLMGYLFTAVFHPIVIDPKREVIYTVKRGEVYIFKCILGEHKKYSFFDSHGLIFNCELGSSVCVRLRSIDQDKYRLFKIGVFPPFKDMQEYYIDKIVHAFNPRNDLQNHKKIYNDYFRYLRWITTFSLYPSFLCKKVDDPYYLTQIDEYLAKQEELKS